MLYEKILITSASALKFIFICFAKHIDDLIILGHMYALIEPAKKRFSSIMMCQCVNDMFQIIAIFVWGIVLSMTEGKNLPQPVKIIKYDNIPAGANGEYSFSYLTEDGIERTEISEVKNLGTGNELLVVKGEYRYPHDGKYYEVYYVADENGYRIVKTSPFDELDELAPRIFNSLNSELKISLIGGGLGK